MFDGSKWFSSAPIRKMAKPPRLVAKKQLPVQLDGVIENLDQLEGLTALEQNLRFLSSHPSWRNFRISKLDNLTPTALELNPKFENLGKLESIPIII